MASGSTTFTIMSSGFASCAAIPAASTCEAKPFPQGTSPALSWTAGPTGTMSYAIVFKDLSVLARTASTDPNYNRGYHYVMWDIPATVTSLPAAVAGGFAVPGVSGALQWSNFNNYGFFGPCPNFDPAMPTNFNDVYSFQIYALPFAKAPVPAAMMGTSTVRLLDNVFKPAALAVAEYRGTSNAHASEIPAGVLPPTAVPPVREGDRRGRRSRRRRWWCGRRCRWRGRRSRWCGRRSRWCGRRSRWCGRRSRWCGRRSSWGSRRGSWRSWRCRWCGGRSRWRGWKRADLPAFAVIERY